MRRVGQVDDDVKPGILCLFADSVGVPEWALGEVLTAGINYVLADPVS